MKTQTSLSITLVLTGDVAEMSRSQVGFVTGRDAYRRLLNLPRPGRCGEFVEFATICNSSPSAGTARNLKNGAIFRMLGTYDASRVSLLRKLDCPVILDDLCRHKTTCAGY